MRSAIPVTVVRTIRHAWRHAWATGATRVESAAVLRLVAASTAAGVPVATMLDAWAEDGRGGQGTRLERAARLLRRGATAAEAVTRVPGLVREDHATALAFGERVGLVGPVVRVALAGDDLLDPTTQREFRGTAGYLVVVVVMLLLTSWLLTPVILPQLVRVFDDMQIARPAVLVHWLAVAGRVRAWLWVPAALAAAAAVVSCSSTARGGVVRPFVRPRRVTAALDALAVAEACGTPVDEAALVLAGCQGDPRIAEMLARVPGAAPLGGRLLAAGLIDATSAATLDAGASDAATVLYAVAAARRDRSRRRRAAVGRAIGPVVLLAASALVLFQALAVFIPLVNVIHALS